MTVGRDLTMTVGAARVSTGWLALREPADAAARARGLVAHLQTAMPAGGPRVIHDMGCGTGAMGRWLAPLLSGPQHWVLHDRDPDLLAAAARHQPGCAADGTTVSVEVRQSDITRLGSSDLAGATLITASALLDVLSEDELWRFVAICSSAGCPVLLTLSVVGRVRLSPSHPLDRRVAAAFNAHQRRRTERGRLAGPDAVALALAAFSRRGYEVLVRPSPWRLGAWQANLAAHWFQGWVDAARAQRTELAGQTEAYGRERLMQARAGRLAVTLDHADLLAIPSSHRAERDAAPPLWAHSRPESGDGS